MLSAEERGRYARQLALPGFGAAAQERLREGRVLVVGCGGLGSPALLYLAAAGVGRIGFVDSDLVDLSNLQRQILHATTDIGRLKTDSAEARLRALNPHLHLESYPLRLSPDNARQVFAPYDVVIDAADTYATKYLVNDVCCSLRKPFVHAGVMGWCGQAMTVLPGQTACLRCIAPTPPAEPEPAARAILGTVPGLVGTLAASEAIKLLTGLGTPLADRLLVYDALAASFLTFAAYPAPACPACSHLRDSQ